MYKLIIILLLIVSSFCISFDLKKMCACPEYIETTCILPFCSWDGSSCIPLECKYKKSEETCNFSASYYQCYWNRSSNTCEDHSYQCNEITDKTECKPELIRYFGLDCTWTTDKKCDSFRCVGSDESFCDRNRCSMNLKTFQCDVLTTKTCSEFETAACIYGATDKNGQFCIPDSATGTCKEAGQYPFFSCSIFSDSAFYCDLLKSFCTYDSASSTCRAKQCSDEKTQDDCDSINIDTENLSTTLCMWKSNSCVEGTESDISTLTQNNCLAKTLAHYTWTSDGKCVACTDFVDNPMYSQYSHEIIMSILLLGWLVLSI